MAPHHLSHPYPRPQGGMNITGPPSLHQLNRMPRQDPQYNMSRSPNSRHSDPRMHPTGNAGHYMQVPTASVAMHEHLWNQEHMTHHQNNSPPSNHSPEVDDVSFVGPTPTNNSNLFNSGPLLLGQPVFYYPFHQGTQLLQGQFPGFQQVLSPPQVGIFILICCTFVTDRCLFSSTHHAFGMQWPWDTISLLYSICSSTQVTIL